MHRNEPKILFFDDRNSAILRPDEDGAKRRGDKVLDRGAQNDSVAKKIVLFPSILDTLK